ncbi:MAG TPA: hypothetical protein VN132_03060, partial [Bdellovibrio sp.]|nr:hypothetical protein [Bdellovibrio sp.]
LEFREERGWSFAWDHLMSAEEMRFKYHHYLETFFEEPSLGREFDLLKIEFCWRRARGCEIDFQNEGFKILKHLRQNKNSNQNLRDQLRSQIGLAWPSGSVLEDITVHQLGSEFSLQL